jgi:hypothetical protein
MASTRQKTPWEWAALGLGLAATAGAAFFMGRLAKKTLQKKLP